MTYETQLTLGIFGLVLWGSAAYRWLTGGVLGLAGRIAVIVGFASALIILPFGSLQLLGLIDPGTWFVTGTVLRLVVVLAGIVGLLDQS